MPILARIHTLLAAKPIKRKIPIKPKSVVSTKPEFTSEQIELTKKIVKALKAHGFTGKPPKLTYPGIFMKSQSDDLYKGMRHIGMTPSPADNSWYDRNAGVLVVLRGETGKEYYITIQYFKGS